MPKLSSRCSAPFHLHPSNAAKQRATHRKVNTSFFPSFVSTTSVALLLGFAYCPAIRPTRTTGTRAPQMTIRLMSRTSLSLASIWAGLQYEKSSAQSPDWRRNAWRKPDGWTSSVGRPQWPTLPRRQPGPSSPANAHISIRDFRKLFPQPFHFGRRDQAGQVLELSKDRREVGRVGVDDILSYWL